MVYQNEILKKEYGIEVDREHILSYLGKPEEVFLGEIERDYNITIEKSTGTDTTSSLYLIKKPQMTIE